MTDKITPRRTIRKQDGVAYPGMMGDGTEEQNLDQHGNPAERIQKIEVTAAFRRQRPAKQPAR